MSAPEVILVRAVQTCGGCPSQWDAWDLDGRYWYLRFRHGYGTMSRDYFTEDAPLSFDAGCDGLDGVIGLEDFCERAGVTWAPGLEALVVAGWEAKPADD